MLNKGDPQNRTPVVALVTIPLVRGKDNCSANFIKSILQGCRTAAAGMSKFLGSSHPPITLLAYYRGTR